MAVDYQTREKYAQQQLQKHLLEKLFDNFSKTAQENSKSLEAKHTASIDGVIAEHRKQQEFLNKVGKALVLIFKKIPEEVKLPDIFTIKGNVDVDSLPPVNVENLSELQTYFTSLEKKIETLTTQLEKSIKKLETTKPTETKINNLDKLAPYFSSLESKISSLASYIAKIPAPKITLPTQEISIPKIELPEINIPPYPEITFPKEEILQELRNLQQIFVENSQKGDILLQNNDLLLVMRKVQTAVENLVARPTFRPQPVTNVTLNPLNGVVKTTDNTVGTIPVSLPQYGQLFNRRSLIIYNNSANTIYLGGSDVTVNNGLPLPANSYSPAIDAGYDLQVFGIAAQTNNDVRVIEISKDLSPNVQE